MFFFFFERKKFVFMFRYGICYCVRALSAKVKYNRNKKGLSETEMIARLLDD